MGFFDRFTSKKGRDQTTGPKRGVVKEQTAKEAEQKVFAAVPGSKEPKVDQKVKTAKSVAPVRPTSPTAHVAQRILLRPIVTEKSTRGGSHGQYTFEVALGATKSDIAQSVHHLYGVTPVAVNINRLDGRVVRFGRTFGRTKDRKKAIVTLPAGKSIDVVSA